MKLFNLLFVFAISFFAFSESVRALQCTNECKLALFDSEFEFDYHSGASSNQITSLLVEKCGHQASKSCKMGDPTTDGSIVYLEYAGCVYEETKADCAKRYHEARK